MSSFNANVIMYLDDYEKINKSSKVVLNQEALISLIVEGIGNGILTANMELKSQIFCPPLDMAINRDNYVRIMDDEILRLKEKKSDLSDLPLSIVLLWGLIETFPCPNK